MFRTPLRDGILDSHLLTADANLRGGSYEDENSKQDLTQIPAQSPPPPADGAYTLPRSSCAIVCLTAEAALRWAERMPKNQSDYELTRKIEDIHLGSKRVYGSPRIHGNLSGIEPSVSHRKVERLMKKNDIRSKTKKKFKVTTDPNHSLKISQNYFMQDVTAQRPYQVRVTDITYVPTKDGKGYLCTVLDVYSRKVVG